MIRLESAALSRHEGITRGIASAVLGAALVLLFRDAVAEPLPAQLTPDEMRDDLAYLRDKWSHEDRSLSDAARADFEQQLRDAAQRVDKLGLNEFSLEVARLV